jgi:hypothetical protein
MKLACAFLTPVIAWILGPSGPKTFAAELPKDYFNLMASEVRHLESAPEPPASPAIMLAAAVLYARQHPDNPAFGNREMLNLALQVGDLVANLSERDPEEDRQHYEWEIHFWLDAYRLLEGELTPERKEVWRNALERNVRWFAGQTDARIDFPRYQGPFIRTSTNHYALFASTVYLAGRILGDKGWEDLGAHAMHRLASEEQAVDGYWGEFTDSGPASGYDYLTMNCVAVYWEHSRDTAALHALRRSVDFHQYFTWPDGTPVETLNGRNRHWGVSSWGHFGFSHWPDGRRFAEFLSQFFVAGEVSTRDLGRLSQSALYYHEGPTTPIPQDLPHFVRQLTVPAGIRKSSPWTVCLSGLIEPPSESQFTLSRQGALSVYHNRLGLIVSGANSKHQPELATFMETVDGKTTTVPVSSRLRMTDTGDRLGLAHRRFFAVLEVPPAKPENLDLRIRIIERGRGRMRDAQLNLQLVLKAGESLETAHRKIVLSEERVDLGLEEIGGFVRHRGWTIYLDASARLTWPVFGFNPYRNAPETELRHAVGVLSVPLKVHPVNEGELNWRRQEIAFRIKAGTAVN